ATPTSPMPECRLSGAKFKKGTAVVITLLLSSCPEMTGDTWACTWAANRPDNNTKNTFFEALIIVLIELIVCHFGGRRSRRPLTVALICKDKFLLPENQICHA